MADEGDDDGTAQRSEKAVTENPLADSSTKGASTLDATSMRNLIAAADVTPGKYVTDWKTVRGMVALHVSLSTDMARLYKMKMNRAQKLVGFILAFVYGMGQVARNAATFGQAAFCTDTRLQDTPFTADTTATMLALIGIAFGLGKAIWGPMLDRYDPRIVYLLLMAGVNTCTVAFTYMTNLNVIIGIFTLSGFLQSGLYPGTTAMTARWFDAPQQGRVFALRGVGSRLGTIISSWVVGGLLTVFEWPTAVRGAALISWLGLLVGAFLQKHPTELETACACLKGGIYEAPSENTHDGDSAAKEEESPSGTAPPFAEWFSDSRFWSMNAVQVCVNVLLSVEAMTPVFVNTVLKPPTYISALMPSCVSIGIVFSITVCGAILEKKNTATRHMLTTAMLAFSALTCFVMFLLVTFISGSNVCTTEAAGANDSVSQNISIEAVPLTNSSCISPANNEGYVGVHEGNLEASSLFNVSADCDRDRYFTGAAAVSVCSADGEAYVLSGCEYNSCIEKEVTSDSPAEVCENPWHGSMGMVTVFASLLIFLGCSIGYTIYVPPFAFVCQFAGPNVGTMSSLYAVSGAIGSMAYLGAYSAVLGTSAGWSGVWLLMTGLGTVATLAMVGFTVMDCQGGEEFKGGRFDEAEIRALFKRIDTNRDGIVDRNELSEFLLGTFDGRALPRPGVSGQRPVGDELDEEVKRMMQEADPTGEVGSRQINYSTFQKIMGVGHASCLDSVFDYIDNKISTAAPNGEINTKDLKQAFAFLGFDVRSPLVRSAGNSTLLQVLEQIASIVESSEIKDTISKEDFKTFMLPLMRRSVTGVEG